MTAIDSVQQEPTRNTPLAIREGVTFHITRGSSTGLPFTAEIRGIDERERYEVRRILPWLQLFAKEGE
jgi:hypothetical protein